jgi:hypothetical protein
MQTTRRRKKTETGGERNKTGIIETHEEKYKERTMKQKVKVTKQERTKDINKDKNAIRRGRIMQRSGKNRSKERKRTVILGIIKYALSNTQVKCPRMRHKF